MVATVAIIIGTFSSQIGALAEAEKKGIEAAGGTADIFQLSKTELPEAADEPHAKDEEDIVDEKDAVKNEDAVATKVDYQIANKDTLLNYDFYLFGINTNIGSIPTQWAEFWDRTGGLWAKGAYNGKVAGLFVTSAGYGDGQETTIKSFLNYLTHHGIIYIPLGYKNVFAEIANIEEVHGSTAWGAGVLCGPDGKREASPLELKIAETQGKTFYDVAEKFIRSSKSTEKKTTETKKDTQTKKAAVTKKEAPKRVAEKTNNKEAEKKGSLTGGCCTLM